MKRALFVTTIPITLSSFLLPFAEHFRDQGWRVDAMAEGISSCIKCAEGFDRVFDVKWSRNPLDPRNLLSAPGTIRGIVNKEDYDIVHVHTPVAAFVTRLALRKSKAKGRPKIIYTAHGFHFYKGGPPLKNAAFLSLEKLAGRWTDYLIVINKEDEQAGMRHRIVAPEKIRRMPGVGIDTKSLSPEKVTQKDIDRVRKELGLKPDERLFLMVAEFNPGKRHRDVISAFARLNDSSVHIAFAGTGPLMQAAQAQAKELGVDGRAHFLGFREDIPALIRSSIATILPTEREGLPRSVMESLSLGTPVIGTDIRGMRDLVSKDCGLLVRVGSIEGFAEAMCWIINHPAEARKMGETGRRKMQDEFDLKLVIKETELLYYDVLGVKDALS